MSNKRKRLTSNQHVVKCVHTAVHPNIKINHHREKHIISELLFQFVYVLYITVWFVHEFLNVEPTANYDLRSVNCEKKKYKIIRFEKKGILRIHWFVCLFVKWIAYNFIETVIWDTYETQQTFMALSEIEINIVKKVNLLKATFIQKPKDIRCLWHSVMESLFFGFQRNETIC